MPDALMRVADGSGARRPLSRLGPRPAWLTRRVRAVCAPEGSDRRSSPVQELLDGLRVNTVCRSAKCPNIAECHGRRTATFMVLGDRCTRDCRFCAVAHGRPAPPEADEPSRVAEAARRLGLEHAVVTSVTRDDLPDGGAEHFAATVRAIRGHACARAEVLVPDFQGRAWCVRTVVESGCEVFAHNVETVPRLYETVRPGAGYERSLAVLAQAAHAGGGRLVVKSGLMVGLGEEAREVEAVMRDLLSAGCRMLTLGQYLSPGAAHVPVSEYVTPERFAEYAAFARRMGFAAVAAGPFVRSSYRASEMWDLARAWRGRNGRDVANGVPPA